MKHKTTSQTNTVLWILYICAIASLIYLILPYFWVIVLAWITAYMVSPLYNYAEKKTNKDRLSLLITRIAIVCVFVIPLSIVLTLLSSEIASIYVDIRANGMIQNFLTAIQWYIENVPLNNNTLDIDISSMQEKIVSMLESLLSSAGSFTASVWSSIVNLTTSAILYIFVTTWLIVHGRFLISYIKEVLPLQSSITQTYLERLWKMTSWIINSTLIIAVLQWLITAISFALVGIPYFIFFMTLSILLAIIPMLWTTVIAMIVWIILLLTWNIRWGIIVILVNQLLVNNIDNVLRPKLITKEARINDTLLIIAVFSWLAIRGIWWVLYWPVIMSFILTTFEMAKKYLPWIKK